LISFFTSVLLSGTPFVARLRHRIRVLSTIVTTRIGLGLAAAGRPGYINLGRDDDLPPDRSVAALRSRTHELLDEAYARGVRYIDVARSYGRAEEFLASWLSRAGAPELTVGSKWGYAYTAGWPIWPPRVSPLDCPQAVPRRARRSAPH
jgi:aryl-alcohol dehydrogenase-like predicted oxidoreductase